MLSKDNTRTSLPDPNLPDSTPAKEPSLPPSSSSPSNSIIMASDIPRQHVSPYGPPAPQQGNGQNYGLPPLEPAQDNQTSNQYPQYSYDIQLRYPQDSSRSYPPPPPLQPQQGVQLPPMAVAMQDNGGYATQSVSADLTGQIAPVGVKPRVTATLWEDEGTLCFQVDVNGTCVARREDNHMINGTKLLNVAGMTRGRRDGILKSEKQKHVVKIGPMHLKGVWIPFERALEFANREKITEMLYPLFVHNIGALLYHPINRGYPAAAQIPRMQEVPPYPAGMSSPASNGALPPPPALQAGQTYVVAV